MSIPVIEIKLSMDGKTVMHQTFAASVRFTIGDSEIPVIAIPIPGGVLTGFMYTPIVIPKLGVE